MRNSRFLILLALLALVASPFAAASGLCCQQPAATCCSGNAHHPCSQAPATVDCSPALAACGTTPGSAIQTPATEPVPAPAPAVALLQAEAAPVQPHVCLHRLLERSPRPRTPLLEGGACLHTTIQPPRTASSQGDRSDS